MYSMFVLNQISLVVENGRVEHFKHEVQQKIQ